MCFLFVKTIFDERIVILCTHRGAFCFSWKELGYKSNGKFNYRKENFIMTEITIFVATKNERGDAQ